MEGKCQEIKNLCDTDSFRMHRFFCTLGETALEAVPSGIIRCDIPASAHQ